MWVTCGKKRPLFRRLRHELPVTEYATPAVLSIFLH